MLYGASRVPTTIDAKHPSILGTLDAPYRTAYLSRWWSACKICWFFVGYSWNWAHRIPSLHLLVGSHSYYAVICWRGHTLVTHVHTQMRPLIRRFNMCACVWWFCSLLGGCMIYTGCMVYAGWRLLPTVANCILTLSSLGGSKHQLNPLDDPSHPLHTFTAEDVRNEWRMKTRTSC